MNHVVRRTALLAALVMTVVLTLVPAASSAPKTRACGTVGVVLKGGVKTRGMGIRATGYSCRLAQVVVRSCLRDRLRGWKSYRAPSRNDKNPQGLTGLDRGRAHISFEVRGRGGCA